MNRPPVPDGFYPYPSNTPMRYELDGSTVICLAHAYATAAPAAFGQRPVMTACGRSLRRDEVVLPPQKLAPYSCPPCAEMASAESNYWHSI